MSYARYSKAGSDVCVYPTAERVVCAGCSISSKAEYSTYDRTHMLLHLFMHRAVGDQVPQAAIDRLRAEITGKPYRPADAILDRSYLWQADRLRVVESACVAGDIL